LRQEKANRTVDQSGKQILTVGGETVGFGKKKPGRRDGTSFCFAK